MMRQRQHCNLALGLASSAWSALIALAAVPFYLRFLGTEAYGLIGFFIALQAIFSILDMGLSATMSREVARCRAQGTPDEARRLLRTLEVLYWAMAVVIAGVIALGAGWIAEHWLADKTIPTASIRESIILMGLVIGLRWPIALYSGALIGAQRLNQVSLLAIAAATLTNIGAVLILWRLAATIQAFFIWQAVCAPFFALAYGWFAWREIGVARAPLDFAGLKRIWRFSGGLSIAAILGTLFMQSDRLILGRLVSLADLGSYTLAGTVARVLYVVLTPTFNIIYPRMTALHAVGDQLGLKTYYRVGTRLLLSVIIPFSAFVALFAHELLLLWTGDLEMAQEVAPLVAPIIAGTALNGVMHFPYALQLASGKSHLPAVINLTLLVVFIPLVGFLATAYGVYGGALAWLSLNVCYVALGTWLTHRLILRGLALRWPLLDVAAPVVLCVFVTFAGSVVADLLQVSILARLAVGAIFAGLAVLLSGLSCPPVQSYIGRTVTTVGRQVRQSISRKL